MKDLGLVRKYGKSPYNIVLVHGGPGAVGELEPVAIELVKSFGVLEPFQSKSSVNEQVEELKLQIKANVESPICLIGYSWGAWLAYILASKCPELVSKLILISSGPFESHWASGIEKTRLSRLNESEQVRIKKLTEMIQNGTSKNNSAIFSEFGKLYGKADTFCSNGEESNYTSVEPQLDVFKSVWPEAAKLRESGELLNYGKNIKCNVVAIHGDYDPHPYLGVKQPLENILKDFKFILLDKCGHHPWFEKYAKDEFYKEIKANMKLS